jgi:hypothetical protein
VVRTSPRWQGDRNRVHRNNANPQRLAGDVHRDRGKQSSGSCHHEKKLKHQMIEVIRVKQFIETEEGKRSQRKRDEK